MLEGGFCDNSVEVRESLSYLAGPWCVGNGESSLHFQLRRNRYTNTNAPPGGNDATQVIVEYNAVNTEFGGSTKTAATELAVTDETLSSVVNSRAVVTSMATTKSLSGRPGTAGVPAMTAVDGFATSTVLPDEAFIPTNEPTASSIPTAEPVSNGGLSTGAKAGIGAGVTVLAIILLAIAFVFWRRRKHQKKAPPLYVVDGHNGEADGKAELAGTEGTSGDRFSLTPKLELEGNENKPGALAAGMPEMDGERRQVVPELHGQPGVRNHATELDTSNPRQQETTNTAASGADNTAATPAQSTSLNPPLAGPIPAASDLYPAPPPQSDDTSATFGAAVAAAAAAQEEETDFEFQARRLQERRAIIAERKRLAEEEEQIAMEEEALRRKRVAAQGSK